MIFFNVLAAQGTFIASPGIPTASASAMAICFCRSRLLGMKMYDVINSNTPWWNPVTVCIATNQTFQLYAKDLGWEIFFDDRWNLTIHLVWSNLQSKKCEMLLRNLFMFSPSETRNTFIRITGLSAMSSMFGKKRNAYIYIWVYSIEREREFHEATKSLNELVASFVFAGTKSTLQSETSKSFHDTNVKCINVAGIWALPCVSFALEPLVQACALSHAFAKHATAVTEIYERHPIENKASNKSQQI